MSESASLARAAALKIEPGDDGDLASLTRELAGQREQPGPGLCAEL